MAGLSGLLCKPLLVPVWLALNRPALQAKTGTFLPYKKAYLPHLKTLLWVSRSTWFAINSSKFGKKSHLIQRGSFSTDVTLCKNLLFNYKKTNPWGKAWVIRTSFPEKSRRSQICTKILHVFLFFLKDIQIVKVSLYKCCCNFKFLHSYDLLCVVCWKIILDTK